MLRGRNRNRTASGVASAVSASHDRQERVSAQRRMVGSFQFTHANLADTLETLRHDLHVRVDDRLAEPAKLFHVLLANDLAELLRGDAEIRQQRRDREERAQKSVTLHTKLKVGAIRRLTGDLEPRQGED